MITPRESWRDQLAAIEEFVCVAESVDASVWLRGGWAVDFTVGRITRPHADIDWFASVTQRDRLTGELVDRGFQRSGTAPADQQSDLLRSPIEHGIAWIRIDAGEAFVAGGPWAGAPWPSGMLRSRYRELQNVRAPVIAVVAQIEIKEMTPTWQPHLPGRPKDRRDIGLLRHHLRRQS